jgi:hypothetical protein
MDWSEFDMDSLYELYKQHFHRLRADVIQVNHALGSTQSERTWMELLSRTDFETMITAPIDDPELIRRWVRCFIRGHEHEFPALRVA